MQVNDIVSQEREVHGFDQVSIRDYGELIITQGPTESLTIETNQEYIDSVKTQVKNGKLIIRIGKTWLEKLDHAIRTSLTRQPLRYHLTVDKLVGLEVLGAIRVTATDLKTDRLSLRLRGATEIEFFDLTTDLLKLDLPGAGRVTMTGKATEQMVALGGTGVFEAAKLESKKASIDLAGACKATVWVADDLEVTIRGIGSVDYYGSPRLKKQISGLGSVTGLGKP
ncbi:MAG: DUF2807 domain-containing protein [Anaerolineales bacterium]|jgi:hypothetical protein